MLEYIGYAAFDGFVLLEALFLPMTFKEIEFNAILYCKSLRLLVLPNAIDLSMVGYCIINGTIIEQHAKKCGCPIFYEWDIDSDVEGYYATVEFSDRVNEWLKHHTDLAPFHQLCYRFCYKKTNQ